MHLRKFHNDIADILKIYEPWTVILVCEFSLTVTCVEMMKPINDTNSNFTEQVNLSVWAGGTVMAPLKLVIDDEVFLKLSVQLSSFFPALVLLDLIITPTYHETNYEV